MDDDDFFDFSKEFTRKTIKGGYVNGRMIPDHNLVRKKIQRPKIGNDYATQYQLAEQQDFMDASKACVKKKESSLDDIDMEGSTSSHHRTVPLDTYRKYNFDSAPNNIKTVNLPISSTKYQILNEVDNSPVVVIQGATGCGKTTQVPQFILDDAKQKNVYCNIVVTQPRRIAAISIAKRVCSERNWTIGELVGYQIGLHAVASEDTRLLYCTTGVLLQKLIAAKHLLNYTHIILDEVHERDSEMDLLLIVIRKLLLANYGSVKIILMSATINAIEFSEYFKFPVNREFMNAPIVNVDRKSLYDVKEFYLCQLDRLKVNNDISFDEPGISDGMYTTAIKLIVICERFDAQEAADQIDDLDYKPSILIFLPGIYEIETMYKKIIQLKEDHDNCKIIVYPLHSTITAEEQQKVFTKPPAGYRKVILSTNIAESSITVPDIKYVIDFCLTKNLVTDSNTNFTTLKLEWASKSNCRQRAGRAGRVMNGRVYRLVPKIFYDYNMPEHTTPEMLRCPLENIVLKAKILDMGTPHSILALAMNPPNSSDILNTILVLKETGAFLKTVDGNYEHYDGDITYMGRIMSTLPLDIRVSKLIILGYVFNVLEDAIIIAAGLTVRNIFATPLEDRLNAYGQKLFWADGSGSDIFAILNAYKVWADRVHRNLFQNKESENIWAKRYFVQIRALREMSVLIEKIKERLQHYKLKTMRGNERRFWSNKEKPLILKVIISGAFYPNYFHRSRIDEREAFAIIGGRDPCNTVYYKGLDPKYIGILYEQNMKDMLKQIAPSKNLKIAFDNNSQRIYVTFLNSQKYFNTASTQNNNLTESVPGRVQTEVYKAVKMRSLKPAKSVLAVLSPVDALQYAQNHDIGETVNGIWIPKKKKPKSDPKFNPVVPLITDKEIVGIIPHIDHCNKFFFQPNMTLETLRLIHEQLVPEVLIPFTQPSDINFNEIIAAPFTDENNKAEMDSGYFRAKVLRFNQTNEADILFDVFYIDYGNTHTVKFTDLRKLDKYIEHLKKVKPCVFECYLAEISPSVLHSPREIWTAEAVQEFLNFTSNVKVTAEIYSFVNNTAAVYIKKGQEGNFYIHEVLLRKGYAQSCEENYMSKADHEYRERRQLLKKQNLLDDQTIPSDDEDDEHENDIEPPPLALCRHRVYLDGPFSPVETNIHSLLKSDYRSASIEQLSVNSVLLDTESQECHYMIVAVNISTNKTNGALIARNTTLMPKIKGFDVLMGLIFCPTMEINLDPTRTRFASFLTGLGYDPKTKAPLYEEHDMLLKSDVEISLDDLEHINQMRYSIDTLLFTEPGVDVPEIIDDTILKVMNKIHDEILYLLTRDRNCVDINYAQSDFTWGKYAKSELDEAENMYGKRAILPLHSAVILEHEIKESDLIKLRTNCEQLHKLAKFEQQNVQIECKLCKKTLENLLQIRIHLYTILHLDREKQINYKFDVDEY